MPNETLEKNTARNELGKNLRLAMKPDTIHGVLDVKPSRLADDVALYRSWSWVEGLELGQRVRLEDFAHSRGTAGVWLSSQYSSRAGIGIHEQTNSNA
ncbi:heat repeat containing protein [Moniliophthora roreri]|nr:heat repeat containing protein [Moniliophthora roreri]